MVLTQEEFDEILSNKTKMISENIAWIGDKKNSETVKFRVPVTSDRDYPIFGMEAITAIWIDYRTKLFIEKLEGEFMV